MRPTICRFLCRKSAALVVLFLASLAAHSQTDRDPSTFSHKYSLGFFAEYSPTSTHVLLGYAQQRELAGLGVSFAHRLFMRHSTELDYLIEVRPLLMESDPTLVSLVSRQYGDVYFSPAIPVVDPGNLADPLNYGVAYYAIAGYNYAQFSRRWTYTGGASPFGLQLNGFKRSRIQPEVMANAGFLLSPREIPVVQGSYFNFVFQFGGGIEWYRTNRQSILFEYRYHHFSNGHLGTFNPGTDSGVFKLTYRFGLK